MTVQSWKANMKISKKTKQIHFVIKISSTVPVDCDGNNLSKKDKM